MNSGKKRLLFSKCVVVVIKSCQQPLGFPLYSKGVC